MNAPSRILEYGETPPDPPPAVKRLAMGKPQPTHVQVTLRVSAIMLARFEEHAEKRRKRTGKNVSRAELMKRGLELALDALAKEDAEARARAAARKAAKSQSPSTPAGDE